MKESNKPNRPCPSHIIKLDDCILKCTNFKPNGLESFPSLGDICDGQLAYWCEGGIWVYVIWLQKGIGCKTFNMNEVEFRFKEGLIGDRHDMVRLMEGLDNTLLKM